jgi:hypothetical protein
LHIFFEDGPQSAPYIAVSTFQDLIDRCIERVVFHNENNGNLPPGFPFEPCPPSGQKEIPLPVLQIVRHARSLRSHRMGNSLSKES